MARHVYNGSAFLLKFKTQQSLFAFILAVFFACIAILPALCADCVVSIERDMFLKKYFDDKSVEQVIVVVPRELTKADFFLYVKEKQGWKQVLVCPAFLGKAGIGKEKEGDMKTPTGDYTFTMAFGIKPDPGSKISYTMVSDSMYWCGDKKYYNTFVDTAKVKHRCKGEHLINYTKQYAYALAIDYNRDCVWKKGSGIFLHCKGEHDYTAGCIAVSEDVMRKLLTTLDKSAHVLICKDICK